MQLQQLETDKVKESYNTQVCTVDDLIQNYGKNGERRSFCTECADWETCKGSKWSTCPYRKEFIRETKSSKGVNKSFYHFSEEETARLISLYKKGLSNPEIAEIMDTNKDRVRCRIYYLSTKGLLKKRTKLHYDWNKLDPKIVKLRKWGVILKEISNLLKINMITLTHRVKDLKKKGVLPDVDGRSVKKFYRRA